MGSHELIFLRHCGIREKMPSAVGNTEVLAGMISRLVGCDVHGIEPADPYPDDYEDTRERYVREQNANARPAIANPLASIEPYDTVLLGSPIWNVRAPMIMSTFVEGLDFRGKTVVPFVTYAVRGLGTTVRDYTAFAWERGDTRAFALDVDSLQSKLESQYGPDAQQIIATYRRTMPNATAPELFVMIASITMMGLGSIEIAEKKAAQQDAPVYLYLFGYKSEMTIPGTEYAVDTPHAMDITFKFNNETLHNSPGFLSGNNLDRFVASYTMAELWASFARTGTPAAVGVPEWPAYTLEDRSSLRIDTRCEVLHNRYSEELAMW